MKGFQAILAYLVYMLLAVAVVGVEMSEAATYFVAQSGNDDYTCSQSQVASTPRRTINSGLTCLSSGDTLQVAPGTYLESIFSINGSVIPNGSPDAYTKILGNGEVFIAPVDTWSPGIYMGGTSSYVEFSGIGTDGEYRSSVDWPGCCGLALDGAYPGSVHHIHLLNAEFKNNKCGSMGFSRASDVQIIGNYIHDDQCNSFSHGLYIGPYNERFLIANNTVEGFTEYGIQLYSSEVPTASETIIRNNIFRKNGSAFGGGMSIGGVNNQVYHNAVYGNTSGIRIQYAGPLNAQVYDNRVFYNATTSIYVDESALNSVVRDNVLYSNGFSPIRDYGWGTVAYDNMISDTALAVPADIGAPGAQKTTPSSPTLGAPSGLLAQCSSDGNSVTVRWNAVLGAENYYLRINYLANDTDGIWYIADGLDYYLDGYTATSFTGSVNPGSAYQWWVHSANSSMGVGPFSSGTFICPALN